MAPRRRLFSQVEPDFLHKVGLQGLAKFKDRIVRRGCKQMVAEFIRNYNSKSATSTVRDRVITLSPALISCKLGLPSSSGLELDKALVLTDKDATFKGLGFSRFKREYQLRSLRDASLVPLLQWVVQFMDQKLEPSTIPAELLAKIIFALEGGTVSWAKYLNDRLKIVCSKAQADGDLEAVSPVLSCVLEDEETDDESPAADPAAEDDCGRTKVITSCNELVMHLKEYFLRNAAMVQELKLKNHQQLAKLQEENEVLVAQIDEVREVLISSMADQ